MLTKISSAKLYGKTTIQPNNILNNFYSQIKAEFFPAGRYQPEEVGGLNYRILDFSEDVAGKPSYTRGDESISWNNESNRWEMRNIYSGVINFSPENTAYPYQVKKWYYGSDIYDPTVTVIPYISE
jgi:hypothetical protein